MNVRIAAEEDSLAKEQLQFDLQLHQCKAERAYQQLKEDSALSQSLSTVDTITFDQQSLPTLKLSTGIVFYKDSYGRITLESMTAARRKVTCLCSQNLSLQWVQLRLVHPYCSI